jgi:hypothetical protein
MPSSQWHSFVYGTDAFLLTEEDGNSSETGKALRDSKEVEDRTLWLRDESSHPVKGKDQDHFR